MSNNTITIFADLAGNSTPIDSMILRTNQVDKTIAAGGELKMLTGRAYLVPIKTDTGISIETSDDYYGLKMCSDVAILFEVKYILKNKACILPIKHNISIRNNQRLCIIY
jgi:hypothetical protein